MSLTVQNNNNLIIFDDKKVQLLRDTICKGANEEELQLFVHACKRTGLDPFMRQVHAVKRWDSSLKRESMTIQTGIDGYRLIADRSGNYAPGKEPTFIYDKEGRIVSATAYVKKRTSDGTWHEVSASAYYAEYVCTTRDGKPNNMWATKAHIMLSKCAEALALRKAFPAELSGIYTKEEMDQADNGTENKAIKDPIITQEEAQELNAILNEAGSEYTNQVTSSLRKMGINDISMVTFSLYNRIKTAGLKKRDEILKNNTSHVIENETMEVQI